MLLQAMSLKLKLITVRCFIDPDAIKITNYDQFFISPVHVLVFIVPCDNWYTTKNRQ